MSEADPKGAIDQDLERMRDQLLESAVAYGARQGIGLSTVSREVAGDGKFLPGLKGTPPEELNFTVGKYRKVMRKLIDRLGPPPNAKE
ncbi:MAG: hypothetical protein JJ979_24145 [Roseibium sp.]|nr:hypothetical protein [Roseibium sp.]